MNQIPEKISIDDLMSQSGVKFGTSGARGLVEDMTDRVCYAYVMGFLQHLREQGELKDSDPVGIAGDLRPSTGGIMSACALAVSDFGARPLNCGRIPSPAVAAFGLAEGIPTLMVTGSHIPADRNGIKFNRSSGEILKEDEAGIRSQSVEFSESLFDNRGAFKASRRRGMPRSSGHAFDLYVQRYLDFFPPECLLGLRLGFYEHSTVAATAFLRVLTGLGAEVSRLGRSQEFVPVDTEAVRKEDVALARKWATDDSLDAVISADGDGDRPLISDEQGRWLRGDIAGILCARYLGVDTLVTPVSSNTAVDRCGWFRSILRTRIGSPYVIAGMEQAMRAGGRVVAGYEANGGFLTATDVKLGDRRLPPLPTRDALIVILSILMLARERSCAVSELLGSLPARFTASDRIKNFPTELSHRRLAELHSGDSEKDKKMIEAVFGKAFGEVRGIDSTDGLRIEFVSGEIAHLRPSGNAPELRAYTEADSEERAREMNGICLNILAGWRD